MMVPDIRLRLLHRNAGLEARDRGAANACRAQLLICPSVAPGAALRLGGKGNPEEGGARSSVESGNDGAITPMI